MVPFDYPTGNSLPKPMVPMESRDSEDVPIATLESLWLEFINHHFGHTIRPTHPEENNVPMRSLVYSHVVTAAT